MHTVKLGTINTMSYIAIFREIKIIAIMILYLTHQMQSITISFATICTGEVVVKR